MSVSVSVCVGDEESRRVEAQELLQIPASSSCPNGISLDVRERRESCCARSIHTSVLSAARCLVPATLLSSARSTHTSLFSLVLVCICSTFLLAILPPGLVCSI